MNNARTLPKYITIPMELFGTGLSMTALCIYGFLLSRHSLSVHNGQRDEHGRVYVVYPIASLAEDVGRKKDAVIGAVHELEKRKLIEVKRFEIRTASTIYVNVPEGLENPTHDREKPTLSVGKNPPLGSGKSDSKNIYNNRYNNNSSPNTVRTDSSYISPNGQGKNQKRKGTGSSMFAPIPDYENCEWYGL